MFQLFFTLFKTYYLINLETGYNKTGGYQAERYPLRRRKPRNKNSPVVDSEIFDEKSPYSVSDQINDERPVDFLEIQYARYRKKNKKENRFVKLRWQKVPGHFHSVLPYGHFKPRKTVHLLSVTTSRKQTTESAESVTYGYTARRDSRQVRKISEMFFFFENNLSEYEKADKENDYPAYKPAVKSHSRVKRENSRFDIMINRLKEICAENTQTYR